MSSINKRFFIFGFLLMFSISTVFAGTFENNFLNGKFGAPSLTTEKGTYLAGENVVISGQGFSKFENVSLTVENYSDSLRQDIPLMNWNVYANSKGTFTATIPFDSLSSENG